MDSRFGGWTYLFILEGMGITKFVLVPRLGGAGRKKPPNKNKHDNSMEKPLKIVMHHFKEDHYNMFRAKKLSNMLRTILSSF